ncbi:bifunctional transcriptional activator/DNA repair enzyme AdaA [Rhodohalobacter sulfatireducens]|uniref:Methylated-DNA--protein-cysteine methyltransferase n=1 Tax=Rhodohalobacter sulfatireducens TaxID=2911366 RepID=A0ABS9KFR3_9BACT|nr:methylated-DNA--[protein]-cysteine S-methyltransferase [Rhodohalobacter sulfatireducens]MCG2589686.1 methylated-DNA--[protein]-cysteine S-methyltransferase [Rhodohalobacter sulfatireducens]
MSKQLPSRERMYKALITKDASFEGIFIVGVKSTGIFCLPTCPARNPMLKNVEFFSTSKDALYSGYRPCKRCKPLKANGETPKWIDTILQKVEEDLTRKWTDEEIEEMDINPNRLRRWFKKHHGTTFHGYVRLRRLGNALGQIKHGENATQVAYDHGYNSLSGFREAMKELTGKPVKKGKDTTVIHINRITTPLGPMLVGTTNEALCLLEFIDRRMLETQLQRLQKYYNCTFVPGSNEITELTANEIAEYFDGDRQEFTVPLDVPGSDFQQQVWNELKTIPYGKTRSYKEQAIAIGNLKAIRAVATANGDNRIAIIIPCHRVIGSDGSLTGYGGGLWRKKYLLNLERSNLKEITESNGQRSMW